MKEPKKEPVPSPDESDPKTAATDPDAPPREANREPARNGIDEGDFSHLDPETAARAARIVDAYQRNRASHPDAAEVDPNVQSHDRSPAPVTVGAAHSSNGGGLLPGVRIRPWDEQERPAALGERPNSTPPDSPDAIRASRRAMASQPEFAPEPAADDERITHPSVLRRRQRNRFLVLACVVIVAILAAIAILKFNSDSIFGSYRSGESLRAT